jgi:phage baseplate assembly protein V
MGQGIWAAMLRRARLRGLVEGLVQRVRAEATELDAKDEAERFQDYGFSANPVDGQGLMLTWGGHTIVLRMDRLAERPQLAAHEVCVWHREGHKVTLKAGGVVEAVCTRLEATATAEAVLTAPVISLNATTEVRLNTPRVVVPTSLVLAGKEMATHRHDVPGVAVTTPPL